ncbi:hypothetical protein CSC67_17395 [Pusillimonas caeni]|uniref:phosphoribosyl-AMP cyclohydrolase n=1 Tax=Pusillimonas caeni TaxID=1348472 RepID=UPI000E59AA3A|nr:phosphoribosyl-AMP cyclohydrolase [Pusillimonas caeni]TFL10148.1 hypothetical protein CSC67_17395 [Pusillimonas caeni]
MHCTPQPLHFAARTSVEQVEEGHELAPKFDRGGLIPCVTTDARTGDVLMLGYMNAEALSLTVQTGEAHYWSRSRQTVWHKGAVGEERGQGDSLVFTEAERTFDPTKVYGDAPNPTIL